ncbi:MAG: SURF1 family protein [Rhizobiales bacterium]|nr:SURF1 family protein [Rhizobacter sp.]
MGLLAALLFTGFAMLGSWQLQRRAWKLDLIERVETRVRAPAVAAPGSERWAQVSAAGDEYRRVQVTGRFLADADTFVQAVTERGAGFWLLTPLQRDDGSMLLVNRGFVPPESRTSVSVSAGTITLTGLLRVTEPGGGFLRRNDPGANRWYSRDVAAIAAARRLENVAPYFVDADAAPDSSVPPVGGLTVIAFTNNHLVYAITWYTLALMVAAGAWRLMREERRVELD